MLAEKDINHDKIYWKGTDKQTNTPTNTQTNTHADRSAS